MLGIVAALIRRGELPWAESCPVTGLTTDDHVMIRFEAERLSATEDHIARAAFLTIIIGFFSLLLSFRRPSDEHAGARDLDRHPASPGRLDASERR